MFELLIDGIIAEIIYILIIKSEGLIKSFRHMDAKLMGALSAIDLNFGYNTITTS